MANSKQVKLLKEQGVEVWNEYRKDNPDEEVDLNYANLRGAKLDDAHLNNADIVDATLIDADLTGADLSNATLGESDLRKAKLCGATLTNANLFKADLRGADLSNAYLSSVTFINAKLGRAILNNANLNGANLTKAVLCGTKLISANLSNATILSADLEDANLSDTNLHNTDLRSSKGYVFDDTYIRDVRLSNKKSILRQLFKRSTYKELWLLLRTIRPAILQDLTIYQKMRYVVRGYQDPWTTLRSEYTGPRLFYTLLFLALFMIPFVAKSLFWVSVKLVQPMSETNVPDSIKQLGGEKVVNWARCWNSECTEFSIWEILIGINEGIPIFTILILLLIAYNGIKAWLTYTVGPMRDEEERSGYSPAKEDYYWLRWLHRVVKTLFWVSLITFLYNLVHWLSLTVWLPSH